MARVVSFGRRVLSQKRRKDRPSIGPRTTHAVIVRSRNNNLSKSLLVGLSLFAARSKASGTESRVCRVHLGCVCVFPGLVLTRIDPTPHNAHTESDGRWHFGKHGVGGVDADGGQQRSSSSSRRGRHPSVFSWTSSKHSSSRLCTLSLVPFCRPAPCGPGGDFFVAHGRVQAQPLSARGMIRRGMIDRSIDRWRA